MLIIKWTGVFEKHGKKRIHRQTFWCKSQKLWESKRRQDAVRRMIKTIEEQGFHFERAAVTISTISEK